MQENQTNETVTSSNNTLVKRTIGISLIDKDDNDKSVEHLIVNIIGKAFNVLGDFYKDIYRSVLNENITDNYVGLFNEFAKSMNLSVNAENMTKEDIKDFLEKYYAEKAAHSSTTEAPARKRDTNNEEDLDAKRIKELVEKKINKTVLTYGKKYKELISDFALKFRTISEDLVSSIKGGEQKSEGTR